VCTGERTDATERDGGTVGKPGSGTTWDAKGGSGRKGRGGGGGGVGRRDEESEMYGSRKKAKPRGHPEKRNRKMAGDGQGRRDGETELLDTREMDVDSEDPWLTRMR
jgi:hypothetical protein